MERRRDTERGKVSGPRCTQSHCHGEGSVALRRFSRSSILPLSLLAVFRSLSISSSLALLLAFSAELHGEDTVIYATGTDSSGRGTTTGTIIDFTGERLVLRTSGGRDQNIPTPRVVEIKTTWSPQKLAGDELVHAGEYEEAVSNYLDALRNERRDWARRQIMAHCIRCYRELAQFDRAAEAFLILLRQDPKTQYFDSIPLSWSPYQPSLTFQRKATAWLDGGQSATARLLGASWLLSTGTRATAIAALRELTADSDARIASLAEAQLWRTQIVTAKPQDIVRWQKLVTRMPEELRGGPYFTLGRALARQKQSEQAALAFLRVPILYPKDSRLAAAALLSAARELERIAQTKEAVALYREIVRDHSQTPAAAEASSRLENLAAGQGTS